MTPAECLNVLDECLGCGGNIHYTIRPGDYVYSLKRKFQHGGYCLKVGGLEFTLEWDSEAMRSMTANIRGTTYFIATPGVFRLWLRDVYRTIVDYSDGALIQPTLTALLSAGYIIGDADEDAL